MLSREFANRTLFIFILYPPAVGCNIKIARPDYGAGPREAKAIDHEIRHPDGGGIEEDALFDRVVERQDFGGGESAVVDANVVDDPVYCI